MRNIASRNWSEVSVLLVQDCLKLCEQVHVRIIKQEELNETRPVKRFYGHVFLSMNPEPSKLTELVEKYSAKKCYLRNYFNETDSEMISLRDILLGGKFCKVTADQNQVTNEKNQKVIKTTVASRHSRSRRPTHGNESEHYHSTTEEKNNREKSANISISQKLTCSPLNEDVSPYFSKSNTENESNISSDKSTFYTAKETLDSPDQSVILSGNLPHIGKY